MNKLVRIKLTEEEKALLKKLRDSINPDTIAEWGRNQMQSHVKDDYAAQPDAKGRRTRNEKQGVFRKNN